MKNFSDFLKGIAETEKREKMGMILNYIKEKYPQLQEEIKWNQPMFSDHGTFIIGFSISKGHISVAPESVVINLFKKEIEEAGYSCAQEVFRIKWTDEVNFELLDKIVAYNIETKKI